MYTYNAEYGYAQFDGKKFHVYGEKSNATEGNQLIYRIDPNKLAFLLPEMPVYASVHDFTYNDKTDQDPHREAIEYYDKESIMADVTRLLIAKAVRPTKKNVLTVATYVLESVDWQNFDGYLWSDFLSEDWDVVKEQLD